MLKEKRIKELYDFVGKDKVIFLKNLIDDVVHMEEELITLKKLPFIRVNPKDKSIQKKTEAAKLYLSVLAQYTQDMKTLAFIAGKSGEVEDISPLRLYIQNINNKGAQNE